MSGKYYNILLFREYKKARESYGKAIETLSVGKISPDKKGEVEAELRAALALVEGESEERAVAVVGGERLRVRRQHSKFPCMSQSVDIKYEQKVGRHAVASADIAPGEIILVEKPLSWTVGLQNFQNFCQNCVKAVGRTPIPSPVHEDGVFCCYQCLQDFQATFPYNDLQYVQLFSSGTTEGSASVMLAFRLVRGKHEKLNVIT